jgi:hypothetical protein
MQSTLNWREYFKPRRELLLLCTAAMELCWTYSVFALVWGGGGHGERGISLWLFAGLLVFALYGARVVLNSVLQPRDQKLVIVALALLSILLATRATLFSNYSPFDWSWLFSVPYALVRLFIAFSPEALVILMGIFVWWRGIALAQTSFDFELVGYRFRFGVLILALVALMNTWIARIDLSGLLFGYFFFGLLAVALARQEDIGRNDAHVSLPLKGPWLGILAGTALLVLTLGALLARALTPQGVRALLELLRPLEPLLVVILYAVLILVSFLVELVYNIIFALMQSLTNGRINQTPLQLPQRPPLTVPEEQPDLSGLMLYFDPLRMACAVTLLVLVLLGLALSLNRLRKPNRTDDNESREDVPIALDLNPFRRLRNLFRRPHITLDEGGIASIRRIYANLARLAAQRGFPRRDAETPYEFVSELRSAFPDGEPEERAITEAYVRVHYGEHQPSEVEVKQVMDAWQRIKAQNSGARKA